MSSIGDMYGHLKTLCRQWFYTKSEIDTSLNAKQNTLISGTNIKTINNTSLLGSGNINVSGGGGGSNNIFDLDQTSTSGNIAFTDGDDENGQGFSLGDGYLIYNSSQSRFYMDTNGSRDSDPNNELATKNDLTNYLVSSDLLNLIYPVGAIYISVNNTNPGDTIGGTWVQIKDKFLLACGDTYSNGATGGSADATLVYHRHGTNTTGEYFVTSENSDSNNTRVAYSSSGNRYVDGLTSGPEPFHHRVGTNYVGESGTGKNMPPYLTVFVWKRTA